MDLLPSLKSLTPYASSNTYELLEAVPTAAAHPLPGHSRTRSSSFPFHRARSRTIVTLAFVPVVLCTVALLFYHFVFRFYLVDEFVYGLPDVPDYDDYFTWEDRLPQHNATLELPGNPARRYLMFSNQAWGYGLNNQLQEVLLLSHIAWMSQRAYVFQPYTWDANAESNAVLDGRSWRSARIPLSVFISGPTAGGEFAHDDPSPRAVNLNWWENVCPLERRTVVDVAEEHARWGVDGQTEGGELADRWSALLKNMPDPCVEISGPVIFDFSLIASPRILSVWPSLSISPILTRFAWSSLISAAVARNLPIFYPSRTPSLPDAPPQLPDASRSTHPSTNADASTESDFPKARATYTGGRGRRPPSPALSSLALQSANLAHDSFSTNSTTSPTIKGLVAVHLRRGDFRIHCHWLADRTEPFAGWNQFRYLLDRFTPPFPVTGVLGRGKNHDMYMDRCWPEVDQIVARLREVRRLHPGLERVFVLTNGKKDWVDKLKRALLNSGQEAEDGNDEATKKEVVTPLVPGAIRVQPVPPSTSGKANWKAVYTSKDLDLLWTEREIDQAVDMEIARRAEVFLGNGFSSLTSNIVMLRLADGGPIQNIRFW